MSGLPDHVAPDTPLRLEVAAKLAFPYGGMTASGLRREAARGNLTIERVAGKIYTTLGDIAEMRKRCREKAEGHTSGSARRGSTPTESLPTQPHGKSSTATVGEALDVARTMLAGLRKRSENTSPESTFRRRPKVNVIPLPSRSQT